MTDENKPKPAEKPKPQDKEDASIPHTAAWAKKHGIDPRVTPKKK